MMTKGTTRVLVTGGTGTIGSFVLPRLLEGGWEVALVGRTKPFVKHPRLIWRQMDLLGVQSLEGISAGCEAILHMANLSKVDPEPDYKVAMMLGNDALNQEVPHFFYTSSIRVYGASLGIVDETAVAKPCEWDVYGQNKLRIEGFLRDTFTRKASKLRIMRIGSVVSEMIVNKISPRVSMSYLLLWGRTYPHFIHVRNVSDAIVYLLNSRENLKYEVYNITREIDSKKKTYADLYGPQLSFWKRLTCKYFAAPRILPYLLYRWKDVVRETRSATILERNLRNEGWVFQGDDLAKFIGRLH